MNLETTKLELVKLIISIDNPSVIERLLTTLKSGKEDFWLELSEQEKHEIELGIQQLDSGQRISFGDFIEKASK